MARSTILRVNQPPAWVSSFSVSSNALCQVRRNWNSAWVFLVV